jgi:hypothetical protein
MRTILVTLTLAGVSINDCARLLAVTMTSGTSTLVWFKMKFSSVF